MIVRVSPAQGRLAGTAAVAYAVLAGLENMDFLTVPGAHADPAEVVAYYAIVPGILAYAGLLGLGAYVVFAAALWALLPGDARARPAAVVLLAGGLGGPLLAAVGIGLRGWLIAHPGTLDQEVAAALHGSYLTLRYVAGLFIGLFLLGVWRSFASAPEVLPRVLRIAAGVIGAWTVLAASAAFSSSGVLGSLAFTGFVADAIWVAVVGWYLLLGRSRAAYPITLFGIVAIAAGVSGVALVAFPAHTDLFFSWGLAPPTVAALGRRLLPGRRADLRDRTPAAGRPDRLAGRHSDPLRSDLHRDDAPPRGLRLRALAGLGLGGAVRGCSRWRRRSAWCWSSERRPRSPRQCSSQPGAGPWLR